MTLKANLHLHTKDDPLEDIDYTFFEAVEEAKRLDFDILALTCHQKFINKPVYHAYAAKRDILFMPGLERNIETKHVLILNPDHDVEKVNTFKELEEYKKNHPDILIIAPHPYFPRTYCLKEKLETNIHLFDAIEHSWFFTKKINFNKKAELTAKKYRLPFIATSDTHCLEFLNTSYALIDAEAKTVPAVLQAIKNNRFRNITPPLKFWQEMIFKIGMREIKNLLKKHRQASTEK